MGVLPLDLLEADAVSTAYSGMSAQRARMNAIANNLANINTLSTESHEFLPYLKKEVLFKTLEPRPSAPDEQGVEVHAITPNRIPFKDIYDPQHPNADERGYYKAPNISTAREMVNMIEASRAYEANLRSMKVAGGALTKTVSILEPVQV